MRSKKLDILVVAVILAIIVAVGIYNSSALFGHMKIDDVKNHALQWSQQGITQYRLGVHFKSVLLSYPGSTGIDCSQEIEVENNQVVHTMLNNCPGALSFTIDNLFSIIEDKATSGKCDPEGCKCGILAVDAVYDPVYQYPKAAKTYYERPSPWWWPGNFCMGIGWDDNVGIALETYYFQPIQ